MASSLRNAVFASLTFGLSAALVTLSSRAAPDRARTYQPPRLPPEWPMFGGTPARNMVNATPMSLPFEWDTETKKNIKWSEPLGSKVHGGPIVAGGRILVGTNNQNPRDPAFVGKAQGFNRIEPIDLGVIMCFRESDGKFLWQAVHEKLPGGQVVDWPREGIASSPAIEGSRLYYVSNRCELVCADIETGKAVWTLDMLNALGVFPHNLSTCSPLVVDETVYVITSNGVNEDHTTIPAPAAPSFLAVNKQNGQMIWKDNSPTAKLIGIQQNAAIFKDMAGRGDIVMHSQWSNPAFGNGQVIFPGGDGWLYSFTPAGKLLWKFDCNPKDATYSLLGRGTRNDFVATPVIYKNRVYIGMGQDPEHKFGVGHLWCIDMTKRGDVSPELRVKDQIVPNPNSAAVWHHGGVIKDPAVVKKLRRNYYFGRTMSTCAIHDGLVYAAELSGVLHCLDAETGKVQWEHDTRSEIWVSPYWADNKIYLGTDDKTMFVFEHGRAKKLLAENEMDGRIRTAPVALHGVLYVATENKLYAIANGK